MMIEEKAARQKKRLSLAIREVGQCDARPVGRAPAGVPAATRGQRWPDSLVPVMEAFLQKTVLVSIAVNSTLSLKPPWLGRACWAGVRSGRRSGRYRLRGRAAAPLCALGKAWSEAGAAAGRIDLAGKSDCTAAASQRMDSAKRKCEGELLLLPCLVTS